MEKTLSELIREYKDGGKRNFEKIETRETASHVARGVDSVSALLTAVFYL